MGTNNGTTHVIKYVAILRCENRPPDHQSFSATLEHARLWAVKTLELSTPDAVVEIYEMKQELIETLIPIKELNQPG